MPKFYITTPVYYVNASPHIGHAYSTIVADVLARQHRMLGDDVFFLTGTDEHGQKIERAAVAAGKTPLEFATENYQKFLMLAGRLNTTMDAFIRTTDDFHIKGVQHLFNVLYEKGYIYLDSYTGVYCVSDESYVDVKAGEPCPECGRKTETVTEENFFFKLTAFTEKVSKLILEDDLLIEPDSRRLEVLNILEKTTRDLSISRSSFTWGIPVPEPAASLTEKKHVVYVWLDALANYMTAVGYGDMDEENAAMFSKWWPADLHVIGKEITRFHCIYWPAFLLAADLPLPKTVNAHGWLLFDKEKMSKSKGNVVSADVVLDAFAGLWEKQYPLSKVRSRDDFAADVLRYYLLREIPFGHDGNFSTDALISRYNSDLANGFGNLISRTFSMIQKFLGGKVPVHRDDGLTFKQWEPLQSSDFATDLT
jgi:methionyl-tRNA synthetase